MDIQRAKNERYENEYPRYVKEILYRMKCWWFLWYSKQSINQKPTERTYKRDIEWAGFSIEASWWGAYWEAITVYTITMLMHHYWLSKEEVWEKTSSEINTLLEMIWCMKNPELLKKHKELRFSSEFELEQYLLEKMKFV